MAHLELRAETRRLVGFSRIFAEGAVWLIRLLHCFHGGISYGLSYGACIESYAGSSCNATGAMVGS